MTKAGSGNQNRVKSLVVNSSRVGKNPLIRPIFDAVSFGLSVACIYVNLVVKSRLPQKSTGLFRHETFDRK